LGYKKYDGESFLDSFGSPHGFGQELGRLAGDESEHLGPAAEEALGFLWPEEMVNPKALKAGHKKGEFPMIGP